MIETKSIQHFIKVKEMELKIAKENLSTFSQGKFRDMETGSIHQLEQDINHMKRWFKLQN